MEFTKPIEMLDDVPVLGGLPAYQAGIVTFVTLLVLFVSCCSFKPSTSQRVVAKSTKVLAANVALMFAVMTSFGAVVLTYHAAGCEAAFCAFVGCVVFFANSLLAGGALAGIAVWGAGLFAVLRIIDSGLALGQLTFLYTLFTVAIVLSYPAAADIFPAWVVNGVSALALAKFASYGDSLLTSAHTWLIVGGLFFLLQGVAHPTFREASTSGTALVVMLGLCGVTHVVSIAHPDSDLFIFIAFTTASLAVLAVYHNLKPSSFVRYDPHETRASILSTAAFLLACHVVYSGAVNAGLTQQFMTGLLSMTFGYAISVAVTAGIFGGGSRWKPEDSQGWRLVVVDMLMLVPFFILPLVVVAMYTGAFRLPIQFAASFSVGLFDVARDLSSNYIAFVLIAALRVLAEFTSRALRSHSLTFLPLLASTVDRGSARSRLLGLTFNGGPDPEVTPVLLQLLAEYDATATFFISHKRASAFPSLVRRIAAEGHEVGVLGTVTVDPLGVAMAAEAAKTAQLLAVLTGQRPTLYRPPVSGARAPVALQAVAGQGFTICMWTFCPWEWEGTEQQVYKRLPSAPGVSVMEGVAGYIVLLHEVIPSSVSGALMPVVNMRAIDTAALLLGELQHHNMEAAGLSKVCQDPLETLP